MRKGIYALSLDSVTTYNRSICGPYPLTNRRLIHLFSPLFTTALSTIPPILRSRSVGCGWACDLYFPLAKGRGETTLNLDLMKSIKSCRSSSTSRRCYSNSYSYRYRWSKYAQRTPSPRDGRLHGKATDNGRQHVRHRVPLCNTNNCIVSHECAPIPRLPWWAKSVLNHAAHCYAGGVLCNACHYNIFK